MRRPWIVFAMSGGLALASVAANAQEPVGGERGAFVTLGPTFPLESDDVTEDGGFNFGLGVEVFARPHVRVSCRADVHSLQGKGQAVVSPLLVAPLGATRTASSGLFDSSSWQAFDFIVGFRLFPMTTRVRPYADIGFGWLPSETSDDALPFGSQFGLGVEWRTGWRRGAPTLSLDLSNLVAGETLRPLRFGVRIP